MNKKGVKAGSYDSLFSGTTNVTFEKFEKSIDFSQIENYYFSGNMDTVRSVRNMVSQQYGPSYIHKYNSHNLQWITPAIMTVCAAFILLLTWFDIQFQKKENFVLMSLGKSKSKIILKNIILDIIVFFGITTILYFILSKFIYLKYMQSFVIVLFFLFICTNSLLYIAILSFDYKQVIYGANIKTNLLSNMYVLKAIIMILTIIVLSTNSVLIFENYNHIKQYKPIKDNYSSYSFLTLQMSNNLDIASQEEYLKTQNKIFADYYKQGKIAFSVSNYGDDSGITYLMLNKNCNVFISDILKDTESNTDSDFTILIPKEYKNSKNVIESAVKSFYSVFEDEEGFDNSEYDVITYNGTHNVTYFDSISFSTLSAGFTGIKNPVIILCDVSEKLFPDNITSSTFSLGHIGNDIMYLLSDEDIENLQKELQEINKGYEAASPNFHITTIGVAERCGQNIAAFSRLVLINSVISIFMLILNFIIIYTIIKMEYTIHSMELALKKILGHSLLKRNKTLLMLNGFSATIGIITVLIACLMFQLSQWYIVLIVGFTLFIIENSVICYFISKTENTKIPKILKGGSL